MDRKAFNLVRGVVAVGFVTSSAWYAGQLLSNVAQKRKRWCAGKSNVSHIFSNIVPTQRYAKDDLMEECHG